MRALGRAIGNVLRVALAPLWLLLRHFARPKTSWVELRLPTRLVEIRVADPLWQRLLPAARSRRATSLQDVRELCAALATDSDRVGLLVHIRPLETGWAACASLHQTLRALVAAGKQVVCYLPEGGGNRELYVALGGSRLVLGPLTALSPLGLSARPLHAKQVLDRLGIEVQVQACGEYKSAAEPASRDGMSEPARRQTQALLDGLHAELEHALAARTAVGPQRAAEVLASGMLGAQQAVQLGVADAVVYEDELPAQLGLSDARARALTPAARYLAYGRRKLWRPIRAQRYIAVIPVRGAIAMDAAGIMPAGATLNRIVTSLREVARDERAVAVVLYVGSPGGSALASELIHRDVQRLAKQKPLVAYFGDVAASGGYYVAAPAKRIVAQPVSVTGSIGVISVKVAVSGLLQRIGLHADGAQTSPHADMFSPLRPMTETETQLLQAHAQELYVRFIEVVAEGRNLSKEAVDAVARGRVWSGRDALAQGLVDVLGGFDRALDEARALLTELTPAERASLPVRVHVPVSPQPPAPHEPSESHAPAAQSWQLLAAWLPESLSQVLGLARREPALFYALDVSELR